ncbi:hypothetical protein LEMLEM_LOCUS26770, partial [Lemmus lemmus]
SSSCRFSPRSLYRSLRKDSSAIWVSTKRKDVVLSSTPAWRYRRLISGQTRKRQRQRLPSHSPSLSSTLQDPPLAHKHPQDPRHHPMPGTQ